MVHLLDYQTLIAIDIEATCCDTDSIQDDDREIIQLGMIKFDNQFNKLGTFSKYIKPTINPILSSFCTRLTSITQEDVDSSNLLSEVMKEVELFLPLYKENTLYCSWGYFDHNIIKKETNRKGIDNPFSGIAFINAKSYIGKMMGWKRERGLMRATRSLQLDFEGKQHDALWDAINVYNIIKEAYSRENDE